MQGLFVISALLMCSLFSIGSAIKCYHCLSVDGAIAITRSVCGDTDKMTSTDCSKLSTKLVNTKFGMLPLQFAKVMGHNSSDVVDYNRADLLFKCTKFHDEYINQDIGVGTATIEFKVYACLGELNNNVNQWQACEGLDNCELCDTDGCNSASDIAASLILSIFLVVMAMVRQHW